MTGEIVDVVKDTTEGKVVEEEAGGNED